MRYALNATGRPIAFCMCDWGSSSAWTYGQAVGARAAACICSVSLRVTNASLQEGPVETYAG